MPLTRDLKSDTSAGKAGEVPNLLLPRVLSTVTGFSWVKYSAWLRVTL